MRNIFGKDSIRFVLLGIVIGVVVTSSFGVVLRNEESPEERLKRVDKKLEEAGLTEESLIQDYQPLTPETAEIPLEIRATFVRECEIKYEAIESEVLNTEIPNPVAFLELQRDLAQKVCAEGGSYDPIESYWYCKDNTAYVYTRDSYVYYCVNWNINKLNQQT